MKIDYTSRFTRDYKRLMKKHYNRAAFKTAVTALVTNDKDKLRQLRDHHLTGNWQGFRELHIEKDWLLIYLIKDERTVLVLTRTGTHQQLLDI